MCKTVIQIKTANVTNILYVTYTSQSLHNREKAFHHSAFSNSRHHEILHESFCFYFLYGKLVKRCSTVESGNSKPKVLAIFTKNNYFQGFIVSAQTRRPSFDKGLRF